MNSDALRQYCLSFPDATENLQWGDDLCFKIRGKIFMILGLDSVPQRMCFKCDPETFSELTEREGIIPAPYVGRYKWVMVEDPCAVRDPELEELIRKSYEMVAANAPRKSSRGKKTSKVGTKKLKTKR